MLTIALTGGIASGKTVVAEMFSALGADIIDTDLVSRELVAPGTPLLRQISDHFGESIIGDDGALDRMQMRERIFNHPDERIVLEDILHPAIRQNVYQRIAASTALYAMVAIPLLTETRYPYQLDRTLVVDAPQQQQLERLLQRDQITEKTAHAILAAQSERSTRLAVADDIIVNDGSLEALQEQVLKLHLAYAESARCEHI